MSAGTTPSSKRPVIVTTSDSHRFICFVEPVRDGSAERRWVLMGENRMIHIGPLYNDGDESPRRARDLVDEWWRTVSAHREPDTPGRRLDGPLSVLRKSV